MIKAIITDFDGTLVDTFEANLVAYQEAFDKVGRVLTAERYRECFGLRFDKFMSLMEIFDEKEALNIHELKMIAYPKYLNLCRTNHTLLDLISSFHKMGGRTAIASTARAENLMNVIRHLGIECYFDLIYSASDVKNGKPNPEIYLKAMEALSVSPDETLIFEDSMVGFEAAKSAGAKLIRVNQDWFV